MISDFVRRKLDELPIIAILRGVTPPQALGIGHALFESGIKVMEVTLNSPEPLESIKQLADHFDSRMAVGAGTVLSVDDVENAREAGAQFIVSPNTNPAVIHRTVELGMHSIPGVATCSECFQAIEAGAHGLKFFPASIMGTDGVRDLMAVLPQEVDLFAVGGVTDGNIGEWLRIGIKGVGLGSNLYKAGDAPAETARKTTIMLDQFKRFRKA